MKRVKKNEKVIVAMSGGLDSSVAAKLLKSRGFNPMGIFLFFWKDNSVDYGENKCCSLKDLTDARRVCQKISVPLYTLNFSNVFKKQVVDYFLSEYQRGRTPNPCIACNKLVKLGLLIERAKELGFDYVASGHYARVKKINNQYRLFRARDKEKDQSYFLYTLSQGQLRHLIFPLGEYTKNEVRRLANKFNLPIAKKKESQEICFIPEKSHIPFLKRRLKLKPGPIKTLDGRKVGEHQGLPLYTIGQRKGVEIGGIGPFYVAQCDYKTNTLYAVKDGNDPALFKDELIAEDVNWIAGAEPKLPLKCKAVIRYRHKPIICEVDKIKNKSGKYLKVKFFQPQRAITPGQSVVFYRMRRRAVDAAIDTHLNYAAHTNDNNDNNEEEVLGGGIISLGDENNRLLTKINK